MNRRSVQRWINQTAAIPDDTLALFNVFLFGQIPSKKSIWDGFSIVDDKLFTPSGHVIDAGNMRAIKVIFQLNRQLKLDNDRFTQIIEPKALPKPLPAKTARIIDLAAAKVSKLQKARNAVD